MQSFVEIRKVYTLTAPRNVHGDAPRQLERLPVEKPRVRVKELEHCGTTGRAPVINAIPRIL